MKLRGCLAGLILSCIAECHFRFQFLLQTRIAVVDGHLLFEQSGVVGAREAGDASTDQGEALREPWVKCRLIS